ncbi:hypothetical protein M0802_002501 [Mischocyttarus mexicanus]|nr:hypothetical protein M0802_002501 [Mischocyttarus mexicanus]
MESSHHLSIQDARLLVGFVGLFEITADDSRCTGYTVTEKTWENIGEASLRNRISFKATAISLASKNMSEVNPRVVPIATTSEIDPQNTINIEVGLPGDTWWYCVERERLANKSEWFRALLTGPMALKRSNPPPLLTLSYLNDEPIIFQSVSTARATLDVAHQYLCSAAACTELYLRCFAIIDAYPSTILSQERFEDLSAKEINDIACRDTLKLPNETILFVALDKWAASNCRKRGIEPTSSNKRAALSDDVWYSVRYLLMTDREFIDGPMAHGILSSEESAFIVAKILGHPTKKETDILTNSPLSRLTDAPRSEIKPCQNLSCRLLKSSKKERQDNKKNRRKECASHACSRICTCFVRVLACVFE